MYIYIYIYIIQSWSQVDDDVATIAFGCIPHEMFGSCQNVSASNQGGLLGFFLQFLVSHVYHIKN